MDSFLRQLEALNSNGTPAGTYRRTLDNIRRDRHNPVMWCQHGNISQSAQQSIEAACSKEVADATGHLEGVVRDHYSFRPKAAGKQCTLPGDTWLRRVVAGDAFTAYHFGDTPEDLERADDLLAKLVVNGKASVGKFAFQGRMHNERFPCWWTWWTSSELRGAPTDGESYVEELALLKGTIEAAERYGAVEITLKVSDLPVGLYKPSSIDGYGAHSRFTPDLTERPYGYTDPTAPKEEADVASSSAKHEGRPELISQSIPYADLEEDTFVQLTYYPPWKPDRV